MKRDRRGRFLAGGLSRRLDRQAAAGKRRGGEGLNITRSLRDRGESRGEPEALFEETEVQVPLGWEAPSEQFLEDGVSDAGSGRSLTGGYCRLCHGKFSSRSLRNAFGKVPVMGNSSEKQRRVEHVLFADFQRLLGVSVQQDPSLPPFVCKNCHAQFYKCHSVLKTFMQKVNSSPTPHAKSKSRDFGVESQLKTGEEQCLVQTNSIQSSDSAAEEPLKDETSDLSEGDILSEDDEGEKTDQSVDDAFVPCSAKNTVLKKSIATTEAKRLEEPKERKKPGPKPGWKNKFKPEREELPTIYKCPYQGCTAVYRGADGMKKHIKEHHEQVRERPCPHPGCNKVFMIDRYLQRHVKLIHTEERNYICDQCGQTFKQRKHLSVHQMRHSGAKPLQCEICGFQCRQRASLKYHMTKHKAEAELEFACDQCGKRFEKAHNLNVHMSMVHPLTQNQEQVRNLETQQVVLLGDEDATLTVASKDVKPELVKEQVLS
ncbi:zinc finger protein 276 isoform X3 [Pleurodeles waltl]|uniref:zinc finger protein 276 isoform X3 n=1 Tax=Pleurodeles waltl TaxID=8319 RepID=UPI0037098113